MSYKFTKEEAAGLFAKLSEKFDIYAPIRFKDAGRYAETDIIKYGKISSFDEGVYNEKSTYPMKEVLSPIQQALFYFTEDEYRESKCSTKPMLVFARPCDINAMKVQAKIYAGNGGFIDMYYERMRERVHYALLECNADDDTCFCVSMGTNTTDDYDAAFRFTDDAILIDAKDSAFEALVKDGKACDFKPEFVKENITKVTLPVIEDKETLNKLKAHPMWEQFNGRCISCGACTIACSTCTCFTTRDIIYGDNQEVGERRRVSASCQVDGFTTVAGGGSYRKTAGDKMRFKMLHKFHDYKARFKDSDMCVGCGRCINRCPELISITETLKKMNAALEEIKKEK
ncbi:MAG: anaerobic sulfite reductase subunit AsrA [Clostridia bacterium]|nr:anaerobic sulfite reductase subunit AsrA [Clostridia bacterium]